MVADSRDPAHQISFTTGLFPPTPWITEIVDTCPADQFCESITATDFAFDANRSLVIPTSVYGVGDRLATWTGNEWLIETLGCPLGDLAFDPASGEATVASIVPSTSNQKVVNSLVFYRRTGTTSEPWQAETIEGAYITSRVLRFNPVGLVPTICYSAYYQKGKTGNMVRLAERRDGSWTSRDIAPGQTSGNSLAFDAAGNPATDLRSGAQPAASGPLRGARRERLMEGRDR